MAEVINTNVFDATKKFVDFAGLDYFWEKAKAYVDAADKVTADKVSALETTVGDANSGLVKDVKAIQDELDSLSGGAGSIATQISNAIGKLDVEDTAVEGVKLSEPVRSYTFNEPGEHVVKYKFYDIENALSSDTDYDAAFYDCSSLTSISIPDSVTWIGDQAFCNCSSLISVYCEPTTPPRMYSNAFDSNLGVTPENLKIYVPMESVAAYKASTYWSGYESRIEGYNF